MIVSFIFGYLLPRRSTLGGYSGIINLVHLWDRKRQMRLSVGSNQHRWTYLLHMDTHTPPPPLGNALPHGGRPPIIGMPPHGCGHWAQVCFVHFWLGSVPHLHEAVTSMFVVKPVSHISGNTWGCVKRRSRYVRPVNVISIRSKS